MSGFLAGLADSPDATLKLVLSVLGWVFTALVAVATLLYKSIWKAINISRQDIEKIHDDSERRVGDIYAFIEKLRQIREAQTQKMDKRLIVLETEHKQRCVPRKHTDENGNGETR